QRNEHRMHYPAFHAQGLCTSSGVVEAGCKVTVGTRLKRAGMHWSLPRRQCHHCPALLSPECSLRRLLGTPRAEEGRVTLTTLMSCARSGAHHGHLELARLDPGGGAFSVRLDRVRKRVHP